MRPRRNRAVRHTALVLVIAALLAACGDVVTGSAGQTALWNGSQAAGCDGPR